MHPDANDENKGTDTLGNVGWRGFLLIVGSVLLIWFIAWLSIVFAPALLTWETRGQFGDMFGAVNSLFSGLALAGIIYAILLQRRELELQRRELKFTRFELKRAAAAQEKSERALSDQVHAQYLAARLSALSTVISHLDRSDSNLGEWFSGSSAKPYVKELEELLRKLKLESMETHAEVWRTD